ncbi:MAG TPA: glycosyltransferase family 2 protein [Armatimonadota bacterium]|nr:glycosyltransferase family 2 protein [Armatimonadota bacterium]
MKGDITDRPRPASLSVIIVSYNVRDLLLACIASLEGTDCEIIVVDNVSEDDSVEAVREVAPHVTVIANSENVGFARANSQGIEVCSGDFILLLNPDTVVKDGALAALTQALADHPNLGVVGPRLVNRDGSLQCACLEFPTPWRIFRDHVLYAAASPPPREPRALPVADCDWVLGACLMTRRTVLEEVGGLDAEYFMYGEEKDFCFRAKQAGHRVACVPAAEVVHYGGQSADQVPVKTYVAFLDSQMRFLRKFRPAGQGWLFASCNCLMCRAKQLACLALGALPLGDRSRWRGKADVFAAGARRCSEHLKSGR